MRGRRRGSLMIGASILLTPEEGQRIAQERNPIEARQIAYAHARLRCAFIGIGRRGEWREADRWWCGRG